MESDALEMVDVVYSILKSITKSHSFEKSIFCFNYHSLAVIYSYMKNKIAKPFLKWAGGKTQLLEAIKSRFPYKDDESFTYIEPFVGSGAVLFWVLNNYPNLNKVVINDSNSDLINT